MNASHSTRARRAALLVAAAGFAVALAGCAENKVLVAHEPASAPVCTSNPMGPSAIAPMLGCANKANLAAMVADPADLVRGRAETPALGAREAVAVENLKKGPEKRTGQALTPATTLVTTSTTGAQ